MSGDDKQALAPPGADVAAFFPPETCWEICRVRAQQYGDERAREARAAAIEEAARVLDLYDKPLYARPTLVALIRTLASDNPRERTS